MKKEIFDRIILASKSPRRCELMEKAGFTFEVIPSNADENVDETDPEMLVAELALKKATEVYDRVEPKAKDNCEDENNAENIFVLGSDTIVSYNGEILGKPSDEREAFDMLSLLSDRTHQVYTGVAFVMKVDGAKLVKVFVERTDVTFYPLTSNEIKDYVNTKDPLDKAGAYGIQGPFAIHVKEIKGDYNNVVGLPIARIYQELKNM